MIIWIGSEKMRLKMAPGITPVIGAQIPKDASGVIAYIGKSEGDEGTFDRIVEMRFGQGLIIPAIYITLYASSDTLQVRLPFGASQTRHEAIINPLDSIVLLDQQYILQTLHELNPFDEATFKKLLRNSTHFQDTLQRFSHKVMGGECSSTVVTAFADRYAFALGDALPALRHLEAQIRLKESRLEVVRTFNAFQRELDSDIDDDDLDDNSYPKYPPLGLGRILIVNDRKFPPGEWNELKKLGYYVSRCQARDCEEARNLVEQERPTVIVLDYRIPLIAGGEPEPIDRGFIEELRATSSVRMIIAASVAPFRREDWAPDVINCCGAGKATSALAIHRTIWRSFEHK